MNPPYRTAAELGIVGCEACGLAITRPVAGQEVGCPRCGQRLHLRQPESVERTLAFLIAAIVLYVPANLLPVITTTGIFGRDSHTIVGGIAELWESGSRELAAIVFIASVAVPLLKIGALVLLVWTAQRRSRWRQRERAGLYRMVETVGHWSMLDVFVVVLLVGMVHFGVLGSVEPQAGLLAFGAVVVATMMASSSFDPRLIWPQDD